MKPTSNAARPASERPIEQTLCLDVARATLRRPVGGAKPLVMSIGEDLADVLAEELAAKLLEVMPPALIRTIGDDLLEGADAIATFVYGDAADKRKVYHLVQHGRFPAFRMGSTVCARKSTVLAWIKQQEEQATTTGT